MEISCEDLTFLFNNVKKPHSLTLSVDIMCISSLLNISVTFSWNLPSLAVSLLYWEGRYVIPYYTTKFGPNAPHFYSWVHFIPITVCSRRSLMVQMVQAMGSATTKRKIWKYFSISLGHCRMSASLIPGYERYAYFFQVNRKLVEFSLGVILMENHR